ncbi:MAG TPA: type B 50S ribosomal protein L31 [Chthoniobacteraceae bacterium]|nr:type B 50S ribosomal protein L31 [Chthoniobacteraceae bacterium]
MKKNIHPTYHPVVFHDITNGSRLLTRSTKKTGETEVIDGVEHYVIPVSVSASSHPFFTGENTFVDTEGRIEKFNKRFGTQQLRRASKPKLGA